MNNFTRSKAVSRFFPIITIFSLILSDVGSNLTSAAPPPALSTPTPIPTSAGLEIVNQASSNPLAATATETPMPTATFCPQPTPEPLWVEPVTSPTDQLSQVITVRIGNGDAVTITTESGTFNVIGDFSAYSYPALVTVTLLANTTHHLTVYSHVKAIVQHGCTYGNYTLSTTVDKFGAPLIIVQQPTSSNTPTHTFTPTATFTPSNTPTATPTASATATFTPSNTPTATATSASNTRFKDITFEDGNLTHPASGADQVVGTVTLETASPLKGSYSARVSTGSSYLKENFTRVDDTYASFYFKLNALPGGDVRVAHFSSGTTITGNLLLRTNGALRLRNGTTTVIGSDSTPLTMGTVYRIGLRQKRGTGSNGVLEAYLAVGDAPFGAPFASTTTGARTTQNNSFSFGATATNPVNAVFDDIRLDTDACRRRHPRGECCRIRDERRGRPCLEPQLGVK